MTHDSIENGVAQEFQTFVILRTSLFVPLANTLMQQSLLVELDVMRIKAQNVVKGRKKLLLLAERELYSINDVVNPHTS